MREATQQLTGDIAVLRSLIAELRPPALDQLGLAPALASLAQRTATANGLEIDADVQLAAPRARLGAETETTVYRVVQESLTNVVKHARAASVQLDRAVRGGRGRGSRGRRRASASIPRMDPAQGFGLAGMRERVELAGGELSVASGIEAGTVVRAAAPCERGRYCALTNPWSSA